MGKNIPFFSFIQFFFIILFLFSIDAVKRQDFRTCDQTYFCKTNRNYAKDKIAKQDFSTTFSLGSNLQISSDKKEITGQLFDSDPINNPHQTPLLFLLKSVSENTFQFLVKENNEKRFVQPERILLDSVFQNGVGFVEELSTNNDLKIYKLGNNKIQITLKPFKIEIFDEDNELIISGNSRGLFRFEQWRTEEEDLDLFENEDEELNENKSSSQDHESRWSEKFGSHTDNKKHGPTSVALDWSFGNTDNVYGIPEHADSFSLTSTKNSDPYRLYNLDVFQYELHEKMALYGAVPLMISQSFSKKTNGIFFLNSAEIFVDIEKFGDDENLKDHQVNTHWISESGSVNFFIIIGGKNPKNFYKEYSKLIGFPQFPPLFSMGYHQCKWNYRNEKEVDEIDQGFDDIGCPLDVIWLDIEHTNSKKYFTWDPKHFPTPEKMLKKIEDKGRKMITIIDPHIKKENGYHVFSGAEKADIFVKNERKENFEGHCWPGASYWIDFTLPEAKQFWINLFKYENYKGSSKNLFTWNDMNEPSVFNGPEITMPKTNLHSKGQIEHRDIHNIYGKYFHEATFEGHLERNKNENSLDRPFVLTRAFFAGSQRTAAVWTGDNTASWGHLEISQPMILSLGIAGIPFVGADVGGFFENANPELLVRWYQASAFHPFFREHGELNTVRKEPFLFDEPYKSIMVKAIQRRYQILPYIYSVFRESSQTLLPIIRPIWMEFPENIHLYSEEQTFLFGSDLLIRPISQAGVVQTEVNFPGGKDQLWYDFYNGNVYIEKNVNFDTPLEKIPVFQRGGSIIPTKQRIRRSTSQMFGDPYTLIIALNNSQKAQGTLYIDDGSTFNFSTKNDFSLLEFSVDSKKLTSKKLDSNQWSSDEEIERIVFYGMKEVPKTFKLNQKIDLEFKIEDQMVIIRKPEIKVNEPFVIEWEL